MANVIDMPRLSDTMTEGVIAAWHVKVGDKVSSGDLLAEVETDKATMDVESFYDGTILHIGVEEGNGIPVGDLLVIIGDEGEDVSKIVADFKAQAASNGTDAPAKEEAAPQPESERAATPQPEQQAVVSPTPVAPPPA
ncbi:MAG: biotin/lipoyl-binding protein, partial [Bacteroidetes bacterium]